MKKVFLWAFMALCLLQACNKESSQTTRSVNVCDALADLYGNMPTVNYGSISLVNGDILKFESEEHYDSVLNRLTAQYEAWSDLFFLTYGCEDEQMMDSIINALGFDDYLPLLFFEEDHGILNNNLRSVCQQQEEIWLRSNSSSAPPVDEIINNPIEQTLYSLYHEVCIGDTIYQLRPNGICILIPLEEISNLEDLRSITSESDLEEFVSSLNNITLLKGKGGCYLDHFKNDGEQNHPEVGNKLFSWSYNYSSAFIGRRTRTSVTMKNYKLVNGQKQRDRAVCALGEYTKSYSYFPYEEEDNCFFSYGPVSTLNTPNKYHMRSRLDYSQVLQSVSTGEVTEIGPIVINHQQQIEYLHVDPENSIVYCRHEGWTYPINVSTGQVQQMSN